MQHFAKAILFIALICFGNAAEAQKSKSDIQAEINNLWKDNNQNRITPSLLRTPNQDIVKSYLDLNGATSFDCPADQVISGFSDLSTPTCTPNNINAANPTATAGPNAVNGSAVTYMRSDAAPAVQQGSASQKGIVQVDGTTITATGGVISAVNSTLPSISDKQVLANTSGSTGAPIGTNATTWFDSAYCNTVGWLIVRTTGAWTCSNSFPTNVVWFGADPTGVANSTTAVSNALSVGKNVYFPKGTYLLTGSCPSISTNGQNLFGDGRNSTIISSTCTGNTFNITNGTSYVEIRHMRLIRTGPAAISGQDGIHCNTLCDYAQIDDVWIENHYNAFRLAGASFNKLVNSVANNNQNHGVIITNADGCTGLQWTLVNNLSQQNNGDGYRLEAVTCGASVGEMLNNSTFANKGRGVAVLGAAGIPLQGPRILGGFFGQDCSDEIYLDTYATTSSKIQGTFLELAGTFTCGVNLSTPPTNVGAGVNATANNTAIVISDNVILGNSYSGINSNSPRIQIVSNNLRINGAAGVAGNISGIAINAGNATVVANSSKGQPFGLFIGNDNVVITGNDLTENTTAPIASGVTIASSIVSNNLPATANIIPFITSTVLSTSPVAMSTGAAMNVTSIVLAPGEWDVYGSVGFVITGGNASERAGWISTTSASLPTLPNEGAEADYVVSFPASGGGLYPIGRKRMVVTVPTTVYLSAYSGFTGTQSSYGYIGARAIR